MQQTNVITGEDNIAKMRNLTILRGLQLEVRTGMGHSRNSVVNAAKDMLHRHGKRVPHRKVQILHAFRELMNDPAVTGNLVGHPKL